MKTTFGQRILAVVLTEQLGLSPGRAMKLYVEGREIDPSWEQIAEMMLKNSLEDATVRGSLRLRPGESMTHASGNVH
jgi:hypothetical protein